MRTLAFVACVLAASCTLDVANYDQQCALDEDCVGISVGDKCAILRCGCENEAINRADLARYEADFESAVCADPFPGPVCLCAAQEAFCDEGTCDLRFVDE